MKQRRRHHWRRRVAIALAVATVAAPGVVANAGTNTVARPGPFDSGVPGGGYVPSNGVVRPDDRADPRGPGSAPVTDGLGRPLDPALVRAQEPRSVPPIVRMDGARNPGAVTPQAPATVVVQPTGFDWRDAGVGIAIGAALVLALAAGMLVIGRRRDPLARA